MLGGSLSMDLYLHSYNHVNKDGSFYGLVQNYLKYPDKIDMYISTRADMDLNIV